ncbi:hypothetical protein COEREDRAFT_86842 [Coemansia reversa NRRL 1564]|uniref:Uncharacterized protein n=1 Tax=Coemansia reversa (strain ATCC 12441 / NRRL 1564) TaxID=763665 RepID=A0A2G5BDI3_COERN|nr:hypothetical protein COEREDRAFT_86842 [Coemansia reversa NRRL 1564]|eukprot:PIA16767.1 hypothetical protein COEREDRAFT_86842 [Coemansia reversa NRRL 1564]
MGCFGREKKVKGQDISILGLQKYEDKFVVGFICGSETVDGNTSEVPQVIVIKQKYCRPSPFKGRVPKDINIHENFKKLKIPFTKLTAHNMELEVTSEDTVDIVLEKLRKEHQVDQIDVLDFQAISETQVDQIDVLDFQAISETQVDQIDVLDFQAISETQVDWKHKIDSYYIFNESWYYQ